jgi:carotenoid cleavage dioxygenase
MTPAFVDRSLLGDDPDPTWPFKLDAFVNVVRHAGHLLALEEGAPPYEMSPTLDTLGRYDFGAQLPAGITAHPKIDPLTGEMIVFRYDVTAPFLTWATVGPDGAVTHPPVTVDGVDEAYMIHDFAITARYVVLVIAPLQLDVNAMLSGHHPLIWKPELGTRIALIPRDRQGPIRWAHGDAFWAWHYANAFDGDGGVVHVDLPWTTAPSIILSAQERHGFAGSFARATIDPTRGSIDVHHLDTNVLEFPRIDDRRLGARHRYVTVAGRSADPAVKPAEHDQLHRYDMTSGDSVRYDAHAALGEAVFAARDGGHDELDGYYLAYATDLATNDTSLLVFDAATFPSPPVAKVRVPRRVPNGLHGNWFPAA